MTITDTDLHDYCHTYVYQDTPVMPATRMNLGVAVGLAERECVRVEQVKLNQPRLLITRLDDLDEPLRSVSVIRQPRYAVRNREAPKRSTLLTRLWSLLR